jgi:uncharacterized repeat protein (TIGR01451 family)
MASSRTHAKNFFSRARVRPPVPVLARACTRANVLVHALPLAVLLLAALAQPALAQLNNTATANGTPRGGTLTPAQDTESVDLVDRAPAIAVTKTADKASVSTIGEAIAYTIEVTNTGNTTLSSISVSDSLVTATYQSGDADSDNALDVGETWIYTATYTTLPADFDGTADIVNTVDVSGQGASGSGLATASDSATVTVNRSAALSVTKTPDKASVSLVGETVVYTVTVLNSGNVTVSGITVTDALAPVACTISGNDTIASLAPGVSETCTGSYAATIADFDGNGGGDGDIDNTADAAGTAAGGIGATSGSGSAAVTLTINPSLSIVKTYAITTDGGSPGVADAGDVITYTFDVTNDGNVTIAGVSVNDVHSGSGAPPVPGSEALFNDAAPLLDSTDATANGTWDTLRPGDTVRFTATYTVTQTDVDNQ